LPEPGGEGDAFTCGVARRGFEDDDVDPTRSHEPNRFIARRIGYISNHNARDAELDDGTRAHEAGLQGGVERCVVAVRHAAGGAQGGHLAVKDGIAFLDHPVVAFSEHVPCVAGDKDGADRAATFGVAFGSQVERAGHVVFV